MKRHKMTIDIMLEMPDGQSAVDARKQVQRYLSECTQVGTICLTRFTSARAWEKKETFSPASCIPSPLEGSKHP